MGGKRRKGQSKGEITSGLSKNTVDLAIIKFVYQQLPAWRDDPDRPDEQSEPGLNPALCKFLNSQSRKQFPMISFQHEEPQAPRRHVDISALPAEAITIGAVSYTIYEPFVVFECKRLPSPSTERKKEYVTGGQKISGGIQRFKLGLHGGKLDLGAMIGYVQNQTTDEWYNKVNSWISELEGHKTSDDCVWGEDEKLKLVEDDKANRTAYYCSCHRRTTGGDIKLKHLWVCMTKGPAKGKRANRA